MSTNAINKSLVSDFIAAEQTANALNNRISFKITQPDKEKKQFSTNYLNPNTAALWDAKHREYREDVSLVVPLDEVMKIEKHCFDNNNFSICPILIKIQSPDVKEIYGDKNYLLQIWKKNGERIYQKALKKPVRVWNISQAVSRNGDCCFLYVLDQEDEKDGGNWFHIMQLKEKGDCGHSKTLLKPTKKKVQDWTGLLESESACKEM